MTRRYLPLLEENGSWIARPDLFLFARMSYEDTQEDRTILQLHEFILNAGHISEPLNDFEADVDRKQLRRNLQHRILAGATVLEMLRIAITTSQPPSFRQGVRLVVFNEQRHEQKKSQNASLEREVRRAFSNYRSTAHLQAAMVLGKPRVDAMEASEEGTAQFLARARELENFLDQSVVGRTGNWNPWRVPETVEPSTDISTFLEPLNADELAASRVTIS